MVSLRRSRRSLSILILIEGAIETNASRGSGTEVGERLLRAANAFLDHRVASMKIHDEIRRCQLKTRELIPRVLQFSKPRRPRLVGTA
jgi:hypothetical protein